MVSHSKIFFFLILLFAISAPVLFAQDGAAKPTPTASPKKQKEERPSKADPFKNITPEQVAETVILVYGGVGGRETLKQIRRTSIERGKSTIVNNQGISELVNYERRILRGENLEKERVRIDQETPNARYSLIYNEAKVMGIYNESVFTPREDAIRLVQDQLWHGLEAVLRYKENGSTLALSEKHKSMGLEYNVLDVTDKAGRITRFFISARSFRVMWLEYKEGDVKYTRKFYDYRYAQGTLVPYRSVLLANQKQVEETSVSTITFGQKVDEEIFVTG